MVRYPLLFALTLIFSLYGRHSFAACSGPTAAAGAREYFSTAKMYRMCDGTNWVDFKTAGTLGACSGAGKMEYDTGNTAYKFCDGTNYVKVTPTCAPSSLTYKSKITNATNLMNAADISLAPGKAKAHVTGGYSSRVVTLDLATTGTSPSQLGVSAAITQINDSSSGGAVRFGNYLFVTSRGSDNLAAVDISSDTPSYVSRVQASPVNQMNNVWSADVTGDGRYVATISWGSGASSNKCYLHLIDTSNPAAMSITSSTDLTAITGYTWCNEIKIRGNVAYITDAGGAVYTMNISNPASPTHMHTLTHASYSNIYPIDFKGNYLFSLTYTNNYFEVINITNPSSMSHTTNFTNTLFNDAYGISVVGNYAFTAGKAADAVAAVNISNPLSPSVAASLTHATNLNGALVPAVRGRYLWVSNWNDNSVAVADIGCDPAPTITMGACTPAGKMEYFPTARALAFCDGSNYQVIAQPDVTPRLIDWPNFTGTSAVRAFIDIDSSIELQLSATYSGSPTVGYRVNNGSWSYFSGATQPTLTVNVWDKLDFNVTGTSGNTATITVTNLSDASAVLDTLVGTVP